MPSSSLLITRADPEVSSAGDKITSAPEPESEGSKSRKECQEDPTKVSGSYLEQGAQYVIERLPYSPNLRDVYNFLVINDMNIPSSFSLASPLISSKTGQVRVTAEGHIRDNRKRLRGLGADGETGGCSF